DHRLEKFLARHASGNFRDLPRRKAPGVIPESPSLRMNLHYSTADVFIPDGTPPDVALARVTHLGIGAHQDDLEFMAFHGIEACHQRSDAWFGGVTCTNGSGSARTGKYAEFTDAQMMSVRYAEQEHAAVVGGYGAMIQL